MTSVDVPTPDKVEAIYGRAKSVRAQMCVSVDESYARALATARQWFDDGFRTLGGFFREAVLTHAPEQLDNMARLSGRIPHAASAIVGFHLDPRRNERPGPYSEQAWENLLLTLGRLPALAWIECAANDGDGGPDGAYFEISMTKVDGGGGTWLLLELTGSSEMLGTDVQREALASFLREQAGAANPVHGEISWRKSFEQCVLEEALNLRPTDTLPTGRAALRGYGWVTVVPEEIGTRLGGPDAIRSSGAFVETEHLGAGGFWCRATQRLQDYDQGAADRVFRTFARVLPPGRPNMWRVYPPNVLAPVDPATVDQ